MRSIQDLLDELEDLAWNHADSYKINKIRNKIDDWLQKNIIEVKNEKETKRKNDEVTAST
ncbi:hypothetical protein ABGF49_07810 [Helcococcus ovis]|uniref:hypothetical protein n=1 Tax=Helcococcus TaxID=31983 RepID=UPI0038B7CB73